jgi:hypothetical protein
VARNDTSQLIIAVVVLYAISQLPKLSLPGLLDLPEKKPASGSKVERTPLDPTGLPELFARALQRLESPILDTTAAELDEEYLPAGRMLAAQCCVETADGRATWHYNVGNLVAATDDDWYELQQMPGVKWARFQNAADGALAMARRIKRVWPEAYKTLYLGLPMVEAYSKQLKGPPSYYGDADPKVYAAGMRARAQRFGWT